MQVTALENLQPRRVVIADDSAEMRWLVRSLVSDHFDHLVEVSDGRGLMWELLRSTFANAQPPALVISDLAMPAYNGLDVLEAWRDLHPKIPLIVITAFPEPEVYDRARHLGAYVLAKPFTTAAMRQAIAQVKHG
ncbi:MAG TPA: response regulator [Kofleriaceae bacterium]|jgi:two-component system nitrogen regulation response regulator GlnG